MSQLERLEALLDRVQENRGKPRTPTPAPAVSAGAANTAARTDTVTDLNGISAPPATKGAPVAKPIVRSPAGPTSRGPVPVASVTPPSPAAGASTSAAAGPTAEPLTLPDPPAPSKPIAQVVSRTPAMQELTFGELLRRSLALRPR